MGRAPRSANKVTLGEPLRRNGCLGDNSAVMQVRPAVVLNLDG